MMQPRIRHCLVRVFLLAVLLTNASAATYTVFDWNGKSAPTEPTGPPFLPTATVTTYTNGGQFYNSGTSSLQPMNVVFTVTPLVYPDNNSNPSSWTVDAAGTNFTYGYQSPDEAEWRFGNAPNAVQLRIAIDYAGGVFNPSFMLMDIDNSNSDEITGILARDSLNNTFYPVVSLVAGSVVRVQGSGASLTLDSNGGNSTDTQALGDAFLEWGQSDIRHIEFTWLGRSGTSIRLANLYAEYDPPGFTPVNVVPEPSTWVPGALGLAAMALRRFRKA